MFYENDQLYCGECDYDFICDFTEDGICPMCGFNDFVQLLCPFCGDEVEDTDSRVCCGEMF